MPPLAMPPLVRFLLKWSLIGMGAGAGFAGLLLVTDTAGLGSMLLHSESPALWLFVFAFSFGISFAQVTVLAAVLLRSDFGGAGTSGSDRLARWKAGGSAEIEPDEPRP